MFGTDVVIESSCRALRRRHRGRHRAGRKVNELRAAYRCRRLARSRL
jgi:hypothetical protein